MPSGARRLPEDERAPPADAAPATAAPEPLVLALQRSAGNAAVARLLAREPAPSFTFTQPAPQAKPYNVKDPLGVAQDVMVDYEAATAAVRDWFDKAAEPAKEGGSMVQSVAELVQMARQQPFTLKDGSASKVGDKLEATQVEQQIRGRASHLGVNLTEHRSAMDTAGMRSETSAILSNLGAIPTQFSIGDDDGKLTASISGKVTGEAKLGGTKVEGEVSPEGAEGTVTVPGGGKVTGKASGEGGGASVTSPGGTKLGVDVTGKGIKAEVKAAGLITVNGSLTSRADGGVDWGAEISIGTIGKLVMPEDVAKVFKGAQETFEKSAGQLARNRDDPAKVKEHGAALAGALSEALEKAKKSAAQKPGWRVGAELKGDSAGGLSGSVTFTWVF